jgi:tRNA(Ile)-lysidine synthetase-like protein
MERARAICAALGVECVTGEGDVAAMAAERHLGIEETARRMRYQFLAFVAGKEQADCVATGHTADDQAETVLMRVIRGAGIRGLRGMAPVAGIPGAPSQRLVRPLLELGRDETRTICEEAGIEPVEDLSNSDRRYTRNRLRLETLPALRAVNPAVDRALLNLAASAREVFAGVERRALELRPLERTAIGSVFALEDVREMPTEALTIVVEREAMFGKMEAAVGRTRLENLRAALAAGTGRVGFGPCVVEVSCGRVRIGPALEDVAVFEPVVLNVPGSTLAGTWRVDVATEPYVAGPADVTFGIGSGTFRGVLRVRQVAPGDRMLINDRHRKVSDLFVDRKVPRWERPTAVALSDADGVVALAGTFGVWCERVTNPDDALYVRLREASAPGATPRIETPGR